MKIIACAREWKLMVARIFSGTTRDLGKNYGGSNLGHAPHTHQQE
jgi:hypothetical protein